MKFEWIKCEDRLPEMPSNPFESKVYLVIWKPGKHHHYMTVGWADGWNCSLEFGGKIDKKYEIKDIIAWAEIPEFEG